MATTPLMEYVNHTISIITNDGRNLVGTLKGYDQAMNIILAGSHERIYSTDEPVEFVQLGLYLIRGDNIAVVGLVDEEIEEKLDFKEIRGESIQIIHH
ncbi:n-alpha-acetyltransferase 38, NatC auxiliary subunit-like protein [Rozella allomycis CSF55]|uniref:LSM2-LSM8 complex subunit LSM8 n=1 Tax=Rozella allomycis (strain CSF55) TaxID=988480 RepID=A0A075AXY2_ROZAC|nr:Like-Sm (LSM) domain-containing protein [Rozella allomycis CSF55]RKP17143.1 n-alpha-acetyltransferase 38, NatC auxiliary subunit-like protein [Rozella allomycis CSF55]RKP18498.1 n-alpha-acetyltransferase 38, NatC auxiliary subunit-like protein [Rozella allomycis CSF55]RKP21760.1 n-alpha-acetyltransferase 38, NatC auxiliary subunit-like protein [Rozella allomycis CSF55]|eukprot:EPZ33434.1 Like-Sm (LSM) domain-containing protein [Rozella allomycis CSF55]